MKIKNLYISLILCLTASFSYGQTYFANGNARKVDGNCYELTTAKRNQLGSVWYADKINLNQDFDLEFYLNFGSSDAGADGIVFVLQTVGNKALGNVGGGIGFDGFSPSFGIEFDTYQNHSMGDPSYDHISILKNGSIDHGGSNQLSGPIPALISRDNIENGKDYLVRVKWDASEQRIRVWFDCELRQSAVVNLKRDIFNGVNEVFWGFTAATGGAMNRQVACLADDILVPDTVPICKGDRKQLNARSSIDDTYLWTPNEFLSDNTIRHPYCSTTTSRRYIVQYNDFCNRPVSDTVDVVVQQPFQMDVGHDSLLCNGSRYRFDLVSDFDSVLWNDGSRAAFRDLRNAGDYRIRAWRGVCYDDDSFSISTLNRPMLTISGDSIFCEGDSVELSVEITPENTPFEWLDGENSNQRFFKETTTAGVTATNVCGEDVAAYSVREIRVEDFDLGNDTLLCANATLLLSPTLNRTYDYEWSTGEQTKDKRVEREGSYELTIRDKICSRSDAIEVRYTQFPQLDLPDQLILCYNEKLFLKPKVSDADVWWQGATRADSFLLFNQSGQVGVRSINPCGTDSVTVNIDLIECFCNLYFPNAVSANGDNLNEYFRPVPDCIKLKSYHLWIYNRWGELIYETEAIEDFWNMEYKSKLVQKGVYTWRCSYSGIENGYMKRKNDAGVLHVLR
ncbi:MAG: gliding motility-associated C-terminal domain-containing protein [Bacteroidia bacterium]|nr:gliding motility-associated C-terminal domain-containing protein [Bacteroidia bacterium]